MIELEPEMHFELYDVMESPTPPHVVVHTRASSNVEGLIVGHEANVTSSVAPAGKDTAVPVQLAPVLLYTVPFTVKSLNPVLTTTIAPDPPLVT